MVHGLEAEYWQRVDFVYLNQYESENREIFDRYAMPGRPVFVFIDADGNEISRWFGSIPADEIRNILDSYLATLET